MSLYSDQQRKVFWYEQNKDKINARRRERYNEERIAKGMPGVEEAKVAKFEEEKLIAVALKFIKAREQGKPDPGIMSDEIEEVIVALMEKRERRRQQNIESGKRFRARQKEKAETLDGLIRGIADENGYIATSTITEIDLFSDDEETNQDS